MGLTYDTSGLVDKTQYTDEQMTSAIFHTLSVGIGQVTADNIVEFIARTRLLEQTGRGTLLGWTDEQIIGLVGLHTNVSFESRDSWLDRHYGDQMKSLTYDASRSYKKITGNDVPDVPATEQAIVATLNGRKQTDNVRVALHRMAVSAARDANAEVESYDVRIDSHTIRVVQDAIRDTVVDAVRYRVEFADQD